MCGIVSLCVCEDKSVASCLRHAAQPLHLDLSWLWLPSKGKEITAKDVTRNGPGLWPQIDVCPLPVCGPAWRLLPHASVAVSNVQLFLGSHPRLTH